MDSLGSLNAFVQVAEARSYTVAGRRLGVSSSAIERLGVRLFHRSNVIFRIPPPAFGDGLAEGVSDLSLENAFQAQASENASLGISGQFNLSGNTGNITRFGWKAQNASMLMFAGEAYNVEEGITNDLFPDERNSSASAQCTTAPEPQGTVNTTDGGQSNSPASDFKFGHH
jgi:CxxC motif-containing protein (DUF1111 family)